jgi:hypothetical protein
LLQKLVSLEPPYPLWIHAKKIIGKTLPLPIGAMQ